MEMGQNVRPGGPQILVYVFLLWTISFGVPNFDSYPNNDTKMILKCY